MSIQLQSYNFLPKYANKTEHFYYLSMFTPYVLQGELVYLVTLSS